MTVKRIASSSFRGLLVQLFILFFCRFEGACEAKTQHHVKTGGLAANGTQGPPPPAKNGRHFEALAVDWENAVATGVSFVASAMANAAGVGGGGLYTPMFSILLHFDTKTATALSQAMITGGAATSLVYNIRLRHPTQAKPLIDYDVALMLEPAALLGISVGVVLNVIFPTWLIVSLLTVLLLYMSWRTILKGIATWLAESRRSGLSHTHPSRRTSQVSQTEMVEVPPPVEPAAAEVVVEGRRAHVSGGDVTPTAGSSERSDTALMPGRQLWRVRAFFVREVSAIPTQRVFEVLLVWLLFLWLQVMKGGQKSPSLVGIRSCQHWFWVLVGAQLPLALGSTALVAWRLTREQQQRRAETDADDRPEGEVRWGKREILTYPFYALMAGMLAGLLGIGGGMVLGPLLLELGLLPQVTAATGALMVLFSSSMAVAQFAILGIVPLSYAIYYGAICAVAGWVGVSTVRYAVHKHGRTSLIIFSLAIVIATSAIAIAVSGSISIAHDLSSGSYMGLQPLCPKR